MQTIEVIIVSKNLYLVSKNLEKLIGTYSYYSYQGQKQIKNSINGTYLLTYILTNLLTPAF